ncbi:hypothetical protein HAS11_17015, partial [Vibrio campbellii]|nr:hypothetical protein [Vibrio campbellii]MBT0279812.1 hypothetical protein [Vibrio campbellii]
SQSDAKQEQGQQSQNQQEPENKKENQKAERQKAKQEEEKQGEQKGEPMQAQAQPEKTPRDDPEFRRLEAVESARDPSFLIRAQMQLQAQQKQRPQQSNKEW